MTPQPVQVLRRDKPRCPSCRSLQVSMYGRNRQDKRVHYYKCRKCTTPESVKMPDGTTRVAPRATRFKIIFEDENA